MSKKLSVQIEQLKRVAPKHTRYGQLYREIEATRRKYKRVTFYTLYISDENTHMLRPHIFKKDDAMSPMEWHQWFAGHMDKIQREAILPGIATRTDLSKQWAVKQYIGWVGNAKYSAANTKKPNRRNKTKSQRRKNG